MYNISIIIPVYNSERYLPRCLDSIIAQTFLDWECILVDDGSTDKSGLICDEYSKKDSRFRVIHKTNGGVSNARNVGMSVSGGEWIFFSDADDTLDREALQILFDMTLKGVKFIMAGYTIYTDYGGLKEKCTRELHKEISVEEAIWEMYKPTDFSYQGYLWCKLFSSIIIKENDLKFNEKIYFNEDGLFILQYLCKLDGAVSYTTRSVYNYYENGISAMGSMREHFNPKFITHFDSVLIQKKEIFAYTKKFKLRRASLNRIVSLYIFCHDLMFKQNEYSFTLHWLMLKSLFASGAIIEYIFACIVRPVKMFAKLILWLFWPFFIIKKEK